MVGAHTRPRRLVRWLACAGITLGLTGCDRGATTAPDQAVADTPEVPPSDPRELLELRPEWARKYAGGHPSDTPRLDIDAVMQRHGLSRAQAVELQNHLFDLIRLNPQASSAILYRKALDRAKANDFEDRRDLNALRERPFVVVFDLDATLYDQYGATPQCSDLAVPQPNGDTRHVKLAPGWDHAIRRIAELGGAVVLFSANLDPTVARNLAAWRLEGVPIAQHPAIVGVLTNSHLVQQTAHPEGSDRREPVVEPSKDLRVLDPELRRVIIVDDNPRRLFQLRNVRWIKKFKAAAYCAGEDAALYGATLHTVVKEIEESVAYMKAQGVDFATAFLPYSLLGRATVDGLVAGGLTREAAIARVRQRPALVDDNF